MGYYLKKIANLARKYTMRSIDGVIYTNSKKAFAEYEAIYFYFNYPQLMHLGDQLYFKPLISKLNKGSSQVIVEPTAGMRFIFSENLSLPDTSINFKKVLFVSRLELLPQIISCFGGVDYFLYDSMSHKVNRPISDFIVNSFYKYYDLECNFPLSITPNEYLDFMVTPYNQFGLLNKSNIIFFSNYVDSGKFRILPKDRDILLATLLKERGNSYVVHLGTKQDAVNDCANYDGIVDLDLRGKTTPQDIFSLMAMNNVQAVYCYDTFVLHVANIFGLKVNVKFKKYFLHNQQKRQAFSSLFAKENCSNIRIL